MRYKTGEHYSASELPPGPARGTHLTHGGAEYHGIYNGHFEFRCDGCGETIFLCIPASDSTQENR
jgi:hypothetical protein